MKIDTRTAIRNVTLLLGSTMTIMAGATIAPSLPQMSEVFADHPHSDLLVKLVLTMPALFIAVISPVSGLIMDKFGRKRVVIFAVALYGIAGTTGLYADSLNGIIIGRAILGVAVAGTMTGFTTLIGDFFKGEGLNRFMGYSMAFSGFGGVFFLVMGGVLADVGWRYPFMIYAIAFLILPLTIFGLREPVIEKNGNGAEPVPILKKLHPGKLALIYFLAFSGMTIFYLIPVQTPYHLKELGVVSNTKIGLAIAMMTLTSSILTMNYKRLKSRLSHQGILAITYFFMSIGYIVMGLAVSYQNAVLGLVITAFGLAFFVVNLYVWLISIIPPSFRGRAVGALSASFFLGQFMSPIFTQPVIEKFGIGGNFVAGGIVLAAFSLGFLVYSLIKAFRPE